MAKATLPFRNEQNQRFTKQLFWEQWITLPTDLRTLEPPFTLYTNKPGLLNFGQEYINDGDPTGYVTSKRLLGEYSYWTYLMKRSWFRAAKEDWDVELKAKLHSEGLSKIRELALGDDAKALQAAKYLSDEFKEKTSTKGRGRPSKEEVSGALAQEVEDRKEIEEAAARIKLIK